MPEAVTRKDIELMLERLAQCPACRAERTNGEWHDDDCPLIETLDRIAKSEAADA